MKLSIAILSIVFSVAYSQVAYIDTWPANDQKPQLEHW
uniref:Uncharacterized protein n=1 Tax=Ciona savignyi TaxID=51511 RepID=H2YFQ7_CIOSA